MSGTEHGEPSAARLRDPGLQAERTALAWSRTGLSLFVNALLALRAAAVNGNRLVGALGVLLLVAAALGVVFGTLRGRQLLAGRTLGAPPWAMLLATVAVTWLACATALAAIALG